MNAWSQKVTSIIVAAWVGIIGLGVVHAEEPDVSTWMYMLNGDWWQVGSSYSRANWLDPENPSASVVTIADSTKKLFCANLDALQTPGDSSTFPGTTLAVGANGVLTFQGAFQTHTINDLKLLGGSKVTCGANVTHVGNVTVYGDAEHPVWYITSTYLNRSWTIAANFESGNLSAVLNMGNDGDKTRDALLPEGGDAEEVVISGSWSGYEGVLNLTKGTYYRLASTFAGLPGKLKISGNAYVRQDKVDDVVTFGELELDDNSVWMLDRDNGNRPYCRVTKKLTVNGAPLVYKTNGVTPVGYIDIIRLSGDAARDENLPDVTGLRLDPLSILYLQLKEFSPQFVIADGTDGEKVVRLTWNSLKYLTSNGGSGENVFDGDSYWTPSGIPNAADRGICVLSTMYIRKWGTLSYPAMTVLCREGTIYRNASDIYFGKIVFVGENNVLSAVKNYGPDNSNLHSPMELRNATVRFAGWASTWGRNTGAISGTGTLDAFCSSVSDPFGMTIEGDNAQFSGAILCSDVSADDGILSGETKPYCHLKIGHLNALGGAYSGKTEGWRATTFRNVWAEFISDVAVNEPTRGVYFDAKNVLDVDEGFSFTVGSDLTYNGEVVKRGEGELVLAGAAPHFVSGGERVSAPVASANVLKIAAGRLKVSGADAVNGLEVIFADGAKWSLDMCASDDLKEFGAVNTAWDAPFASETAGGKILLDINLDGVDDSKGAFSVAICTVNKNAPPLIFDYPLKKGGRKLEIAMKDNGNSVTYLVNVTGKLGAMLFVR